MRSIFICTQQWAKHAPHKCHWFIGAWWATLSSKSLQCFCSFESIFSIGIRAGMVREKKIQIHLEILRSWYLYLPRYYRGLETNFTFIEMRTALIVYSSMHERRRFHFCLSPMKNHSANWPNNFGVKSKWFCKIENRCHLYSNQLFYLQPKKRNSSKLLFYKMTKSKPWMKGRDKFQVKMEFRKWQQ